MTYRTSTKIDLCKAALKWKAKADKLMRRNNIQAGRIEERTKIISDLRARNTELCTQLRHIMGSCENSLANLEAPE